MLPSARGQGSSPGQGTRSHMLQLKILHATTKVWQSNKINKYFKKTCKEIHSTPTGVARIRDAREQVQEDAETRIQC